MKNKCIVLLLGRLGQTSTLAKSDKSRVAHYLAQKGSRALTICYKKHSKHRKMIIKGDNKRWKTKSTIVHNRWFCTHTLHELRSLNVSIVLLTWPKSEKNHILENFAGFHHHYAPSTTQ